MTDPHDWPARVSIVGTPISVVSSAELMQVLETRPEGEATVVAFCNVHSVMTARKDPEVARALSSANVAAPDGMPIAWGLKATGFPNQQRVAGPTFTESALRHGVEAGWRHFFYGSTPETLTRLVENAEQLAPGIQVAGTYSPPFRPPTETDIRTDAEMIAGSGADLVWVGLGMPKQELWMALVREFLPGVALLGVGAAFDFLAGTSDACTGVDAAIGLGVAPPFRSAPRTPVAALSHQQSSLLMVARRSARSHPIWSQSRTLSLNGFQLPGCTPQ